MPRKSKESQVFTPVITRSQRIRTPVDVSPEVAGVFRGIVNSCAASHFQVSDSPLLVSYSMTCVALRQPGLSLRDFLDLARMQALLATRLRLAPSTRDRRGPANKRNDGRMGIDEALEHFENSHDPN